MSETFERLSADLSYLEYQIQSSLTTLYHTVGRLFAGEVLTELLGQPSAGITIGDSIYTLHCEPVNVTILTSLIHGNIVSMHPLVNFTDASGNTQLGQVSREGHVYHGIKL